MVSVSFCQMSYNLSCVQTHSDTGEVPRHLALSTSTFMFMYMSLATDTTVCLTVALILSNHGETTIDFVTGCQSWGGNLICDRFSLFGYFPTSNREKRMCMIWPITLNDLSTHVRRCMWCDQSYWHLYITYIIICLLI